MRSLLDQLYKTKLQLIAVLATVGGTALLLLSHWVTTQPTWADALPLSELGSTLFGTGLLAIFFEYVDRKHGDERASQRVRQAVRQEAPAIRDAVLNSFAFDPKRLAGVASPEALDRIATNALGLRLGDPAMATEIYTDVRDQVIRAGERWRDVSISVTLSPWEKGSARGPSSMFVATIRTEYRVRHPSPVARFACVSDAHEYRDLLQDPTMTAVWYLGRTEQLEASSKDAFEVVQFVVDGQVRPVRRTERRGSQLYTTSIGDAAQEDHEFRISSTYRVLIQQHGHLLYVDVPRPTKGLSIELNYGGCGIRRVSTLDFIASAERPRVVLSPAEVPARSVAVGFDGWVFPKSGVAFVWVLEVEMK